jgi:hypothetical protein
VCDVLRRGIPLKRDASGVIERGYTYIPYGATDHSVRHHHTVHWGKRNCRYEVLLPSVDDALFCFPFSSSADPPKGIPRGIGGHSDNSTDRHPQDCQRQLSSRSWSPC